MSAAMPGHSVVAHTQSRPDGPERIRAAQSALSAFPRRGVQRQPTATPQEGNKMFRLQTMPGWESDGHPMRRVTCNRTRRERRAFRLARELERCLSVQAQFPFSAADLAAELGSPVLQESGVTMHFSKPLPRRGVVITWGEDAPTEGERLALTQYWTPRFERLGVPVWVVW